MFIRRKYWNTNFRLKNSKNRFVIIEASSFQLSHSKFICPDFAFFLNLTNDHLDWHGNMKKLFKFKIKNFSIFKKKIIMQLLIKNLKKIFLKKKF